jgi:pimeloyl-ACP methyl ester carboxylesterase
MASTPTQTSPAGEQLTQVGRMMLCYEEFGDPANETVLLVMGLGMQMLGWDEEFCEQLAGRGFHVVRFDNRDVGLSSKGTGRVNVRAGLLGFTGTATYDLDDMAADGAGLLGALGVDSAHVVGASMGGMIGQQLAARFPARVRSLCSIMASTGRRKLSTTPRPEAMMTLLRPPASTRDEFVEGTVRIFETIGSPRFPPDPERIRERAARSYDRCFYPIGTARQLMAVLASGNRTRHLRSIDAPTVVIHGCEDKLVPAQAGRDVSDAISGARLELIEGMGHDLPMPLWPRFQNLIEENAGRSRG